MPAAAPIAIPAVLGAAGLVSGKRQADKQNEAIRQASGPQPFSESGERAPWSPAIPYLEGALPELEDVYRQSAANPPPAPGRTSGPGSLNSLQHYGPLSDVAAQMRDQAGDQSFVEGGKGFANELMAGTASNPLIDAAAGAVGGNENLQRFIDQGFAGGFNPADPYLRDWLGQRGGGGTDGAAAGGGIAGTGISLPGGAASAAFNAPEFDRPDPLEIDFGSPLFDDEMAKIIGGEYLAEGNPHAAELVDTITGEALEGHRRGIADLDRRARAQGRFGGGAHQVRQIGQQEEFDEALQGTISGLRTGLHENERNRMMEALSQLSSRDQAKWGNLLQEYGIDMGSATSRYGTDVGSATSRYGADQAANTARHGIATNAALARADLESLSRYRDDQNTLAGINALTGNQLGAMGLLGQGIGQDVGLQQFNTGVLADLGGQYLGAQQNALGMVPALEGAGYIGPQAAFDATGQLVGMEQQQQHANAAAQARNAAAQYQHQLMLANRPMDLVSQYLGNLGGVASLGGTHSVEGVRPGHYAGPQADPYAAAVQGGAGGYAFGRGLFPGGGGGGGGRAEV